LLFGTLFAPSWLTALGVALLAFAVIASHLSERDACISNGLIVAFGLRRFGIASGA
jgi:hypothetical protein